MEENNDIRSLKFTLGVYLVLLVFKLGIYFYTGVIALLAEALHTLSDIFIAAFLLLAAMYSRQPADREHMFGHRRVQYVAALVAATLFISFTSFGLYREAIGRLFSHEAIEYKNVGWAIAILALSMAVAAGPLWTLLRQKRRGAAAKAQFMELINDELGLLAALVGTIFVLIGVPVADPIAAIVVATIIAVNAVGLFRENFSYLVGKAPSEAVHQQLIDKAVGVPGVLAVDHCRAEYIGPDMLHVDFHVMVAPTLSIVEADAISHQVQAAVEPLLGNGIVEVHVDATPDAPDPVLQR